MVTKDEFKKILSEKLDVYKRVAILTNSFYKSEFKKLLVENIPSKTFINPDYVKFNIHDEDFVDFILEKKEFLIKVLDNFDIETDLLDISYEDDFLFKKKVIGETNNSSVIFKFDDFSNSLKEVVIFWYYFFKHQNEEVVLIVDLYLHPLLNSNLFLSFLNSENDNRKFQLIFLTDSKSVLDLIIEKSQRENTIIF